MDLTRDLTDPYGAFRFSQIQIHFANTAEFIDQGNHRIALINVHGELAEFVGACFTNVVMYIGVGVVTTAAIFHPAKYGDELFNFWVNHADVAGIEHDFVPPAVNDVDAVFRIFVVHQLHLVFGVGRKTDEVAFAGQRVVLAVDLRHHPPLTAEVGIHHQACGLSAFADINIFFRPGQAALRAQAVV